MLLEYLMLAALLTAGVITLTSIVSYTAAYWWTRGQYNAFKYANDLNRSTQRGSPNV